MKNKIELKKEFESGVIVIDKDNIALYYEFMSDEDFRVNSRLLDDIFDDRFEILTNKLSFNDDGFDFISIETKYSFQNIGLEIFKTKDTLKPIDEYIEEIKASNEYKEYIKKDLEARIFDNVVLDDMILIELDDMINVTDEVIEANGGDLEALYKQVLSNMSYEILLDYSNCFDL